MYTGFKINGEIYIGQPASTKYSHGTTNVISKHSETDKVSKNMTWMAVGFGVTLAFVLVIVIIFIVKRRCTNILKAKQEIIESKR